MISRELLKEPLGARERDFLMPSPSNRPCRVACERSSLSSEFDSDGGQRLALYLAVKVNKMLTGNGKLLKMYQRATYIRCALGVSYCCAVWVCDISQDYDLELELMSR